MRRFAVITLILFFLFLSFPQAILANDTAKELNQLNSQFEELYQIGDLNGALEVAEKSLELAEKTFGENNPYVVATLENMARIFRYRGDYYQSGQLTRRSLAISERIWGKDDPQVAVSMSNLADLLISQGDFSEAETFLTKSIKILEQDPKNTHQDLSVALNNLGKVYTLQPKFPEFLTMQS